jgi:LysR family nitrogen assimilation transcriptional regulator
MDIRKLRYFAEVAQAGSFVAAARRLHVSQPALSTRIRELEEECGAKLLVRGSRGVVLTEIGESLYAEARNVLAALARAEAVAKAESGRSKRLALGASSTPRSTIVPELLKLYYEEEPNCQCSFSEVTWRNAAGKLLSGEIDAALCYEAVPSDGIEVYPLYREDLYLVGSAARVDTGAGDVQFAEVGGVPLIMDSLTTPMQQHALLAAQKTHTQLQIELHAGPMDILRAAILQGRGCTIVSRALFRDSIERGEMGARRLVEPSLTLLLSLVLRASLEPAASSALVQRCRSIVAHIRERDALPWTLAS